MNKMVNKCIDGKKHKWKNPRAAFFYKAVYNPFDLLCWECGKKMSEVYGLSPSSIKTKEEN
jgi:hypothetical protein